MIPKAAKIIQWPEEEYKISQKEFREAGRIEKRLIWELAGLRQLISRPFYYTNSVSGFSIYHTLGDAVHPDSHTHSDFSLHKYDIDHTQSYLQGKQIQAIGTPCKAVDWDCRAENAEELFDLYLYMSRHSDIHRWGLYPHWNQVGFHTDMCDRNHPMSFFHWFQDRFGEYRELTWANYKKEIL